MLWGTRAEEKQTENQNTFEQRTPRSVFLPATTRKRKKKVFAKMSEVNKKEFTIHAARWRDNLQYTILFYYVYTIPKQNFKWSSFSPFRSAHGNEKLFSVSFGVYLRLEWLLFSPRAVSPFRCHNQIISIFFSCII